MMVQQYLESVLRVGRAHHRLKKRGRGQKTLKGGNSARPGKGGARARTAAPRLRPSIQQQLANIVQVIVRDPS